MGLSIRMVSVHVHAMKLDLAIKTPGSCSRIAIATYFLAPALGDRRVEKHILV
jgi:hypothetical protein